MSGILSWGVYLPHRRLDRTTIAAPGEMVSFVSILGTEPAA